MNQYYQKISDLCTQSGLTVRKMCTDLNIRQSVLSDLKAGRTKKLSTETLSKIASYFNVSMDDLLGRPVSASDTAKKQQAAAQKGSGLPEEFARLFMSLSPENQNTVIAEMLKRQREQGYRADQVPGEK